MQFKARNSFITLRPYKPDATKFTADKVIDGDTLRSIIGRSTFPIAEYDSVLTKVSEYGYGLEVIGYEPAEV